MQKVLVFGSCGGDHILSAEYFIIFIGRCLQLIYLILKELPGIIKKYGSENCKKANTIFCIHTVSKVVNVSVLLS